MGAEAGIKNKSARNYEDMSSLDNHKSNSNL